jgi:DNA polymerase delta subunit 3
MSASHRQYLAVQVISEKHVVSYRTLARALKVHVNAAKRMLYDFHTHENAKRPGSVHATYLLAGYKKVNGKEKSSSENRQNGVHHEDEPVPSSPPPFTSSMLQSSQQNIIDNGDLEASPVRTITLVREELLDGIILLMILPLGDD